MAKIDDFEGVEFTLGGFTVLPHEQGADQDSSFAKLREVVVPKAQMPSERAIIDDQMRSGADGYQPLGATEIQRSRNRNLSPSARREEIGRTLKRPKNRRSFPLNGNRLSNTLQRPRLRLAEDEALS